MIHSLKKQKTNKKKQQKTDLCLDKFKLEEVCTGGTCKHSWEEFGIWLHLKKKKQGQIIHLT